MTGTAEAPAKLDGIVESMHGAIQDYLNLVTETARADLLGLTLFGPIITPAFDPTHRTARSVAVVERIDLGALRRLAAHGLRMGRAGIAAPLVMTPKYITASLDTFPLEFIEIMQHHRTLLGEDHFVALDLKDADIRYQCERELKVLLIALRQGLLSAAGRDKLLEAVADEAAESVLRPLRGMLWLDGKRDALSDAAVVEAAETLVKRKLTGVRRAVDPGAVVGWTEFEALYADVEAMGEFANAW